MPVRLKRAADPAGLFFTAAFFSVRPVSPIRNEGSIAESSFAAHGAFPLFWPCSETIWPTEALMQSASFRFFSLQGQETPGSDLLPVHPESQPAQNRGRFLWFTFHPCLHRNGFHASQTGLSCTAFMVMFLLGMSLSVRKRQRPFSMGGAMLIAFYPRSVSCACCLRRRFQIGNISIQNCKNNISYSVLWLFYNLYKMT